MHESYEDDDTQSIKEVPEADHFGHEVYYKFISAYLMLPSGNAMARATVMGRKKDKDGRLIGQTHPNPILDKGLMKKRSMMGEGQPIV